MHIPAHCLRLNCLKTDDIYVLNMLKFYFKYCHRKLPKYLLSLILYQNLTYIAMTREQVANELLLNLEPKWVINVYE